MLLQEAAALAEALREQVEPYCTVAFIAGSIRREKAEPSDIELVVIPRWGEEPGHELFAEPVPVNRLHQWALDTDAVRWIKPGTSEIIDWPPKPEGKYWRGLLPCGMKLDLFLATPENLGAILLIRTGSDTFSRGVMAHALRVGKPCVDGQFTDPGGRAVATLTETEAFAHLGLDWVPPRLRTGPEAVRALSFAKPRGWIDGVAQ